MRHLVSLHHLDEIFIVAQRNKQLNIKTTVRLIPSLLNFFQSIEKLKLLNSLLLQYFYKNISLPIDTTYTQHGSQTWRRTCCKYQSRRVCFLRLRPHSHSWIRERVLQRKFRTCLSRLLGLRRRIFRGLTLLIGLFGRLRPF